jgi:PKD repeat protein
MTKSLLRTALGAFFFLTGINSAMAQCANDNVLVAGNLTPPGVSQSTTQTYNAGQYMLAYVEFGASYTVQTCALGSYDTQITIYEDVSGNFVAYNDDFCGLQTSVTFTSNICGYVRVLLDQYFCSNSGLSSGVMMTQNTAGAAPTLTAAPDQSTCYGNADTIGIAGNGSGGLPPYTFSWSPTANLSTPTAPSSVVTTVTTTTVYTLTLTDANGCTTSDVVQVSVLAAPPVTLGPDTTVCATQFTLDAGNPGSAYLWNTGAGTQQISVTQSGTYSVAVQFASGCINTDQIVVTLTPPPSYSLGSDTSTCGNNVVLDAGSGFVSYAWSTGGTGQTETISASDTIGVTVTDANGCVLTDSIEVVLNPAPLVNLGPDVVQCGGSALLDAGNPGSLFFWSNSTSSQTTNVNTSGTYYVDVLTPAGCASSDTIDVTINFQPVQNLGPDTAICLSSVVLDAGNPGSTYLWSNSMTTQTITVSSGTYSVTVTDPSGCSQGDTIVVTTNTPPNVVASADTAICQGGTANLSATGAVTYLWSNNATSNPTGVTPSTNTAYYVTGTDANGCQASDVVIVSILPASTALFTHTVSMATAYFTNQSTGALTYSWNFDDGSPLDNSASPAHTYTVNGVYTVTLTVTGPCGTDTYTQTITITDVGMEDNELENTLSVYPNPNTGVFTVNFAFAEAKDVTIRLTDVAGREISTIQQDGVLSYNHEMGAESLSNGVYFLTITTVDGTATRKIAVQK